MTEAYYTTKSFYLFFFSAVEMPPGIFINNFVHKKMKKKENSIKRRKMDIREAAAHTTIPPL